MNGRTGSTQTSKGVWSGTQIGPRPYKGTVSGMYRWDFRRGHSFSLGLYTSVYRLIYAIMVGIMENILRWSGGSVLAFGTQVRGFNPGRSRRIFRAKKSPVRLLSEGK